MNPSEFAAKWRGVTTGERASAQSHFIDLCRMLGQPTPHEADPTGEWYAFEKGAGKAEGGDGWADVWMRDHFAWEYKGKRKDLSAAFAQLTGYADALGNPPLLVVCDLARFEIHTHFNSTVPRVYRFTLDDLAADPGLYYWRLGQALTPAARPFQTFISSRRDHQESGAVSELVMSVTEGLRRLTRELDEMVALWQCPSDNDASDELLAEFDTVLRDVWRVYDNLALMSGYFLCIAPDDDRPAVWGLQSPKWKRAMKESGATGRAIVSVVSANAARFQISEQLRHRSTHRAQFRSVTLQGPGRFGLARIELEGQELEAFERATKAIGHPPEDWGLDQTSSGSFLDPTVLAVRLVAHAGYVANAIFEILTTHGDAHPLTAYTTPYETNSALLSSPLSGLIDWRLPLD
jgi:hypothetical protein